MGVGIRAWRVGSVGERERGRKEAWEKGSVGERERGRKRAWEKESKETIPQLFWTGRRPNGFFSY
jgi:hypothetical protein